MAEAVREKCIYSTLKESDLPNFTKWFKYMLAFKDTCSQDVSEKCSREVQKTLGIKHDKVRSCYKKVTQGKSDLLE